MNENIEKLLSGKLRNLEKLKILEEEREKENSKQLYELIWEELIKKMNLSEQSFKCLLTITKTPGKKIDMFTINNSRGGVLTFDQTTLEELFEDDGIEISKEINNHETNYTFTTSLKHLKLLKEGSENKNGKTQYQKTKTNTHYSENYWGIR